MNWIKLLLLHYDMTIVYFGIMINKKLKKEIIPLTTIGDSLEMTINLTPCRLKSYISSFAVIIKRDKWA